MVIVLVTLVVRVRVRVRVRVLLHDRPLSSHNEYANDA
jgi:hypothetical protein